MSNFSELKLEVANLLNLYSFIDVRVDFPQKNHSIAFKTIHELHYTDF